MTITVTFPNNSPGTQIKINKADIPDNVVTTHWNLKSSQDKCFTIITDATGGSNSSNVLKSSLSILEIWLPPSDSYTVRTRHEFSGGVLTNYTTTTNFDSRGSLNSFEKYSILSE